MFGLVLALTKATNNIYDITITKIIYPYPPKFPIFKIKVDKIMFYEIDITLYKRN